MGSTDPAKAKYNTIRRDFGTSIEKNAVHGSDSEETAAGRSGLLFHRR